MKIFLITIDTLRYDEAREMKILKEFTEWKRVYTTGTSTPFAFPSIFAGVYFSQYAPTLPTFVEYLKNRGFKTYGNNGGNIYCSDAWGYDKGFDEFEERFKGKKLSDSHPPVTPVDEELKGFEEWYEQFTEEDNIFAWFHIMDIHGRSDHLPYLEEKWRKLAREWFESVLSNDEVRVKELIPQYRTLRKRILQHIDNSLEGFLSKHANGEYLIIITSDHGEELLEHGRVGHDPSVYEELIHIPFYISSTAKSDEIASRSDNLVSLIDLPALILDIAFEIDIFGVGMSPLRYQKNLVYTEGYRRPDGRHDPNRRGVRIFSVRSKRKKFVADGGKTYCFDLESDSDERNPEECDSDFVEKVKNFISLENMKFLQWKTFLVKERILEERG